MANCELGKEIVQGLTRFIQCEITKKPCTFQRYCPTEGHCVNTDCYFVVCEILAQKREERENGRRL